MDAGFSSQLVPNEDERCLLPAALLAVSFKVFLRRLPSRSQREEGNDKSRSEHRP